MKVYSGRAIVFTLSSKCQACMRKRIAIIKKNLKTLSNQTQKFPALQGSQENHGVAFSPLFSSESSEDIFCVQPWRKTENYPLFTETVTAGAHSDNSVEISYLIDSWLCLFWGRDSCVCCLPDSAQDIQGSGTGGVGENRGVWWSVLCFCSFPDHQNRPVTDFFVTSWLELWSKVIFTHLIVLIYA